jgi:hypothetical protein
VKQKAWRDETSRSLKHLAEELGTDVSTVFRWELEEGHSDKRIPTRGFMRRLYVLSKGAVEPNDYYDLPDLGTPELPLGLAEPPAPAPLLAPVESETLQDMAA